VEGLDAWAARLRDAGYPVTFDGDFPGMRRFYSQDPHGNRLEFLERVSRRSSASTSTSPSVKFPEIDQRASPDAAAPLAVPRAAVSAAMVCKRSI
jgi:hypothetical protein